MKAIASGKNIDLDCSRAESFCTAAAQLLVSAAKSLQTTGLTLQLRHVSPTLRQGLATLGLSNLMEN